jgi:hypothetical protein
MVLSACTAAPATQSPSQPVAAGGGPSPAASSERFTLAGELAPPTDYRTWVFLSSGFQMAYGPAAQAAQAGGVPAFDSVFVERRFYDQFVRTGVWPESTLFVLEVRSSEHTGSIVTAGHFQTELTAVEAELKDSTRFPGGWGFFALDDAPTGPTHPGKLLPATASCYACHAKNAAVENTFTQFYPTLYPVARARGTVRKDFAGIPTGAGELYAQIAAHGWPSARPVLDDTATKWPEAALAREATLNQLGYRLLQDHKTAEALAVLDEIARRFPGSANAWDSLAEVYEGAHQLDDARRANTRGLAAVAADPSLAGPRRAAIERSLTDRAGRLAPRP